MESEIKKIHNPLFKREEIELIIEQNIIPSKAEISKSISEMINKPEELISVKNIRGSFGTKKYKINAEVYHSKEDREKYEIKKKAKKQAGGEAA